MNWYVLHTPAKAMEPYATSTTLSCGDTKTPQSTNKKNNLKNSNNNDTGS